MRAAYFRFAIWSIRKPWKLRMPNSWPTSNATGSSTRLMLPLAGPHDVPTATPMLLLATKQFGRLRLGIVGKCGNCTTRFTCNALVGNVELDWLHRDHEGREEGQGVRVMAGKHASVVLSATDPSWPATGYVPLTVAVVRFGDFQPSSINAMLMLTAAIEVEATSTCVGVEVPCQPLALHPSDAADRDLVGAAALTAPPAPPAPPVPAVPHSSGAPRRKTAPSTFPAVFPFVTLTLGQAYEQHGHAEATRASLFRLLTTRTDCVVVFRLDRFHGNATFVVAPRPPPAAVAGGAAGACLPPCRVSQAVAGQPGVQLVRWPQPAPGWLHVRVHGLNAQQAFRLAATCDMHGDAGVGGSNTVRGGDDGLASFVSDRAGGGWGAPWLWLTLSIMGGLGLVAWRYRSGWPAWPEEDQPVRAGPVLAAARDRPRYHDAGSDTDDPEDQDALLGVTADSSLPVSTDAGLRSQLPPASTYSQTQTHLAVDWAGSSTFSTATRQQTVPVYSMELHATMQRTYTSSEHRTHDSAELDVDGMHSIDALLNPRLAPDVSGSGRHTLSSGMGRHAALRSVRTRAGAGPDESATL